jgi:hypothetical protein
MGASLKCYSERKRYVSNIVFVYLSNISNFLVFLKLGIPLLNSHFVLFRLTLFCVQVSNLPSPPGFQRWLYRGACWHWGRHAAKPDPAGARDDLHHILATSPYSCNVVTHSFLLLALAVKCHLDGHGAHYYGVSRCLWALVEVRC